MKLEKMAIREEEDIIIARQLGRRTAANMGFGLVEQTRVAAAISEITRNVLQYAHNGELRIEIVGGEGCEQELKIAISDMGPGIADIEKAMTHGFSTGESLGAGLPGTKQLVDEFNIQSSPEQGTTVTLVMKKH